MREHIEFCFDAILSTRRFFSNGSSVLIEVDRSDLIAEALRYLETVPDY